MSTIWALCRITAGGWGFGRRCSLRVGRSHIICPCLFLCDMISIDRAAFTIGSKRDLLITVWTHLCSGRRICLIGLCLTFRGLCFGRTIHSRRLHGCFIGGRGVLLRARLSRSFLLCTFLCLGLFLCFFFGFLFCLLLCFTDSFAL